MILFCDCLHKPDYEGGKSSGDSLVSWSTGEYAVLDMGQVYAHVAAHRRLCQLQPDLLLEPRR